MPQKIRTIFFGTPKFGVASLNQLHNDPDFELVASVTNPDKPTGRKKELTPSPIKKVSGVLGIPVIEPETLRNNNITEKIRDLKPDICVVVSYGKIIPKEILEIPRLGFVNIHPSLLPQYRGATPIQTAILEGREETGITIMLIDEEMDHGSILAQQKIEIRKDEYFDELSERLSNLSATFLLETIKKYNDGSIKPVAQKHEEATSTKKFSREDAKINWNKTSREIFNKIRALNPEPGIWTTIDGKTLKIINASLTERPPKEIGMMSIENNELFISTSDKLLRINRLQLEGKKEVDSSEFIKGNKSIKIREDIK